MESLLNTDKYTSMNYNRATGRNERQWLMYADNTVEPVRKDGNLGRKYNSDPRTVDWWTMRKPKDWDPVAEGFNVSLNHDYGQQDKPGGPPKTLPVTPKRAEPGRRDLRYDGGGHGKATDLLLRETGQGTKVPMKTTLGRGAEGYQEFEQRRLAAKAEKSTEAKPRNSTQDAAELNQKEKKGTNERSLAYEYLVPPLWKPRGNSDRDWAEEVLKNKLEEWGDGMKHAGPWFQGLIEEMGDEDPSIKDIPQRIKQGVWPW